MSKIQAHFYPDVDPKSLEDGTMIYISFQRLHKYLEEAVGLREGERLAAITIDGGGIKCKIDYKNKTNENPRRGGLSPIGKL